MQSKLKPHVLGILAVARHKHSHHSRVMPTFHRKPYTAISAIRPRDYWREWELESRYEKFLVKTTMERKRHELTVALQVDKSTELDYQEEVTSSHASNSGIKKRL
ncbi:unnamed protein product [Choristocarpus tenellus]